VVTPDGEVEVRLSDRSKKRALARIKELTPLHRIVRQTLYATGLRVGEVVALQPSDVQSGPGLLLVGRLHHRPRHTLGHLLREHVADWRSERTLAPRPDPRSAA